MSTASTYVKAWPVYNSILHIVILVISCLNTIHISSAQLVEIGHSYHLRFPNLIRFQSLQLLVLEVYEISPFTTTSTVQKVNCGISQQRLRGVGEELQFRRGDNELLSSMWVTLPL